MTTPEDKSAGNKKDYGSSAGCAKRLVKPGIKPVSVEDMDEGIRSKMQSKFGNAKTSTDDLTRYVMKRKLNDPEFAADYEEGYEAFKREALSKEDEPHA
jgi:hypothetical protein